VITRVAPSSVTIRWPGMMRSLQRAAELAAGESSSHILHHLKRRPKPAAAGFQR